jgi:Asp-tRNA(Asn)/Glu-tRNA(Gln) amidotransferase A subunit family amidase
MQVKGKKIVQPRKEALKLIVGRSYLNLQIGGKTYQTMSAAAPSRMPHLMEGGSFAGLRIAVKDVFRVKGLKTSLCNKAYLEMSTPASSTAFLISRLLDGGSQLLGMTKLSSFAGREEPMEAVDYQSPFNPRGDKYQSPAGSSSGSAAAVAAYEWLDITIGTDSMPVHLTNKN